MNEVQPKVEQRIVWLTQTSIKIVCNHTNQYNQRIQYTRIPLVDKERQQQQTIFENFQRRTSFGLDFKSQMEFL